MDRCSKPGCPRAGAAVLGYDYASRRAVLEDPPEAGQPSPHVYVMCSSCAEKLRPPQGWVLDDLRAEPPLFVPADAGAVALSAEEDTSTEEPARRQLFFGYSA